MGPQTSIGHYRILSKLGEGGMGEVYRATDTKLGRDVAIKVLPSAFTQDAARIERFRREAQVLASLNHPNIAAIYGVEDLALVMELVEGPTLAEILDKGPTPLEESLAVARQIAEALEYAHERGVVHRDLKPANIKVTPDGRVKVLDFGLAKAVAQEITAGNPESSPTLTVGATLAGTIMGTAAYMSPEQARGQDVDRRTDIWAFGAVLYEMLTARRAFGGKTITDTLAAVLTTEPDYSLCPPSLPPRILYLLRRCLRKKASERLRDIGEARIWIDEAGEETEAPAPPSRRWWLAGVGIIVVAALLAAYVWRIVSAPALPAWKGTFLGGPELVMDPRISPDGKTLAFQAMVDGLFQLAVMKPETGNWTVLTQERERGSVQEITWSPDGTRLYFARALARSGIYSIPVLGGEERLVLDDALNPEMLPDGSLLVLKTDAKRKFQVFRFWPETGKLQPLPAELNFDAVSPPLRPFPDGKEAAYVGWPIEGGQNHVGTLYALDLATGKSRRLAPGQVISPNHEGIGFPMAITPDGANVLLRLSGGDLRSITAFPRSGAGAPQTWLSLTQSSWYMDAGPDGSLYLDQVLERPEALRFPPGGGRPERLMGDIVLGPVLERVDGSLLVSSVFAGHTRIAMGRPGTNPTPVSETRDEIDVSMTKVGESAVAFPLGPQGNKVIAIASLPDGRITKRLPVPGGVIDALASSPDGRRIFYVSGQEIWSVSTEGGEPTRITEGDGIAAGSEELIATMHENDGIHLLRVALAGGEPVKVPLPSTPMAETKLHPTAVGPGGRLLVEVTEPHVWFYRMATVDPKSGRVDLLPVDYNGDIWFPGWTPDGKIVATGLQYSFSLWRMHR
ncbi:MAG TPA: protein kinase [Verrucomicrobiae bacterium]|nr:protein kinase [Verrucomicrobiae bacterium]